MDERIKSRLFRVTVTQGDRWRAHLENGGEVAAADSLYELRRRVASAGGVNMGGIGGLIARDIEPFNSGNSATGQRHSAKQRQDTPRKPSG